MFFSVILFLKFHYYFVLCLFLLVNIHSGITRTDSFWDKLVFKKLQVSIECLMFKKKKYSGPIIVCLMPWGYLNYLLMGCVARILKPLSISKDFLPSKNDLTFFFPKFSHILTHF